MWGFPQEWRIQSRPGRLERRGRKVMLRFSFLWPWQCSEETTPEDVQFLYTVGVFIAACIAKYLEFFVAISEEQERDKESTCFHIRFVNSGRSDGDHSADADASCHVLHLTVVRQMYVIFARAIRQQRMQRACVSDACLPLRACFTTTMCSRRSVLVPIKIKTDKDNQEAQEACGTHGVQALPCTCTSLIRRKRSLWLCKDQALPLHVGSLSSLCNKRHKSTLVQNVQGTWQNFATICIEIICFRRGRYSNSTAVWLKTPSPVCVLSHSLHQKKRLRQTCWGLSAHLPFSSNFIPTSAYKYWLAADTYDECKGFWRTSDWSALIRIDPHYIPIYTNLVYVYLNPMAVIQLHTS